MVGFNGNGECWWGLFILCEYKWVYFIGVWDFFSIWGIFYVKKLGKLGLSDWLVYVLVEVKYSGFVLVFFFGFVSFYNYIKL